MSFQKYATHYTLNHLLALIKPFKIAYNYEKSFQKNA